MVRTRLYRGGRLAAEDFPLAEVSEHLKNPDAVVWVDLRGPTEADIAGIAEELGLHRLAVEDAIHDRHQRTKLDRYDSHLFLVGYVVRESGGDLAVSELAAFITDRALVTVHRDDHIGLDDILRRWDSATERDGVAFLVHGLLDHIVDSQFAAAQDLDDQIESIEDLMFAERPSDRDIQRRALRLRKSLTRLRRVVLPMRELVDDLRDPDHGLAGGTLGPYFQDVYDNVRRTTERLQGLRELVATLRETQVNIQNNRLNAIMKKVTSWAAIIAVPTAVTGFYGQNLPYPGAEQMSGFWTSTAVIVLASGGLYWLFKRRDWL
ncbi:magnesium transporter CorA family protein [Actinophytocola sp.]|uniref:magnesium transporter CorA family protein n=1 Tax=Actinophytocola sp. TaxID=1872138 RepID=UPI002D8024E2|nr:magnesium transporter CorA family protein [Actinophytocola sp.]HET9140274.1 magnesium transporter CorA family protein [Actinophytocola sp.]